MEPELRMGLSVWAIAAIVCNSLVGVLILILFVVLYKACKVPSRPERAPGFTAEPEHKKPEQKYLLKVLFLAIFLAAVLLFVFCSS